MRIDDLKQKYKSFWIITVLIAYVFRIKITKLQSNVKPTTRPQWNEKQGSMYVCMQSTIVHDPDFYVEFISHRIKVGKTTRSFFACKKSKPKSSHKLNETLIRMRMRLVHFSVGRISLTFCIIINLHVLPCICRVNNLMG